MYFARSILLAIALHAHASAGATRVRTQLLSALSSCRYRPKLPSDAVTSSCITSVVTELLGVEELPDCAAAAATVCTSSDRQLPVGVSAPKHGPNQRQPFLAAERIKVSSNWQVARRAAADARQAELLNTPPQKAKRLQSASISSAYAEQNGCWGRGAVKQSYSKICTGAGWPHRGCTCPAPDNSRCLPHR